MKPVLVVGATGALGGLVVLELLGRGKSVRALVRPGSDASKLESKGVAVVRGDLRDRGSLDRALDGVGALVTTAQGYIKRKRGDSLHGTDDAGNRNLVDAAKAAGLERFVFTSVLTCDKAKSVPHFWQKKIIEDYLEASGVPFVSLRPGAFISTPDIGSDYWSKDLRRGRFGGFGKGDAKSSMIHIKDVASCLARAVDEPRAVGRRIDLGMDRPLSAQEIAALCSSILGRTIKLRTVPWPLVSAVMGIAGVFMPIAADFRAMFAYFLSGQYVADPTVQGELFGPVPTAEGTLRRYLGEIGLTGAPGA